MKAQEAFEIATRDASEMMPPYELFDAIRARAEQRLLNVNVKEAIGRSLTPAEKRWMVSAGYTQHYNPGNFNWWGWERSVLDYGTIKYDGDK